MRAISFVTVAITLAGSLAAAAQVASPTIAVRPAQHGAQLVSITPGIALSVHVANSPPQVEKPLVYYTLDGTAPTGHSIAYQGPFLVASSLTVRAVSLLNHGASSIASRAFTTTVPANSLIWSDEFVTTTGAKDAPDPKIWAYDTGHSGFGNHELETYCAWGNATPPCNPAEPNAYVAPDGYLHIVACNPRPASTPRRGSRPIT